MVHNQKCSLLSRRACVELGLIRRADKDVDEMNTGPTDFKAEFPALFSGLGKLKTECHITLRPDAIPLSLQSKKDPPSTDSKGKKSDRNNASARSDLACNSAD